MKPLIGNRELAREVLSATRGRKTENLVWLGSGAFRDVWLHEESAVVYKRDVNPDSYAAYCNRGEYRRAKRMLRRCMQNDQWVGTYVRIPKVAGFDFGDGNFIIAMQYIKGKKKYPHDAYQEYVRIMRQGDSHDNNFQWDGEALWPTDMAYVIW